MKRFILCCSFLLMPISAWPDEATPAQINVQREDGHYHITASFNTSLSPCAAYHFLTDYDAADQMPGVLESHSMRETATTVKVDRVGDEKILFFHVHLKSTLEFTEYPQHGIAFVQLAGDSKEFAGKWEIEERAGGSTLRFNSVWVPDTVIPLFIIDHFAKKKLADKFTYMAQFAEQRKEELSANCTSPPAATPLMTAGAPPHN